MLEVREVSAGYGPMPVLRDVSLRVAPGEVVGVVGSNGAGKSTLIRTIAGLLRPFSSHGRHGIYIGGERVDGLPPYEVAKRGLAVVPEGSRVFPHMTVLDNLLVGAYLMPARARQAESLQRVYDLFPRLAERVHQKAGTLSGGERQMLAIGRALMAVPRLLILDEPSLGIAPNLVQSIMETVQKINREGMTVLLVEQNVHVALGICHRAYVLENGRVVYEGEAASLLRDEGLRRTYFGL